MGLFCKLFGHHGETENEKEERLYRQQSENRIENNDNALDISSKNASLTITDIFSITGRGTIVVGKVSSGTFHVNDSVKIVHSGGSQQDEISTKIKGIEMFRKIVDSASVGDNVGILLGDVTRDQIQINDMLIK